MAVELDPTVLPVMHKRARPVQRSFLTRLAGGVFMAFAALLCFWLFVLPVVVVALSSVAAHWSGTILPDGFSMRWFERLGSSDFDALSTSLEIGFGVAVLGTVLSSGYHDRLNLTGLPAAAAATVRSSVAGGVGVAHKLDSLALLDNVREAFVHGMNVMLWACGGIALVSAILALIFLPRQNTASTEPAGAGETSEERAGLGV